jgi:pilus assembly protein Flp/PilA
MKNIWKNFVSEESGQGMVEYGLIIALIAVVLIIVLRAMSSSMKGTFTEIANALDSANKENNT